MKRFSTFLKENLILEYLTDTQRSKYSKIEMTPKARSSTDHFFGVGNDHVREEIKGQDEENKSEVHKKVEQHIGTNIDTESYKKGVIKDKYGRDARIGRTIKDEKLRTDFANDSTRAGVKSSHGHYATIVRGSEVAGQTNSEPDKNHPKGHSWAGESCKNVVDGSNKKYLTPEIKHGTVVVRVHDHTDKEIYRATLQPHHNDEGHTLYHLNSEYGIKHSNFTKHANDVASRLSGKHKGGSILYKINSKVYNDTDESAQPHPNVTKEDLDSAMKSSDRNSRQFALQHPKATKEHLDLGIRDKAENVRETVVEHPKATKEHLDLGMKDKSDFVRLAAVNHPNATKEHLDLGMKDKSQYVRQAVVRHPNAAKEHLDLGMKDTSPHVRESVLIHPNATKEHLDLGMKDERDFVRQAVVKHPNATKEHLDLGMKDQTDFVRESAVNHPNATKEHLDLGIKDQEPSVRKAANNRLSQIGK